jgi:hypothetical protein
MGQLSNFNTENDDLRLNNALREVFANRFCHIFLSYEHFVILHQDIEDDLTPDGLDKENTMVSSKYRR